MKRRERTIKNPRCSMFSPVFLCCFSHVVQLVSMFFLHFSNGFPPLSMVFPHFSIVFSPLFPGFPPLSMVFPTFPWFSSTFPRFSHRSPTVVPHDPHRWRTPPRRGCGARRTRRRRRGSVLRRRSSAPGCAWRSGPGGTSMVDDYDYQWMIMVGDCTIQLVFFDDYR